MATNVKIDQTVIDDAIKEGRTDVLADAFKEASNALSLGAKVIINRRYDDGSEDIIEEITDPKRLEELKNSYLP